MTKKAMAHIAQQLNVNYVTTNNTFEHLLTLTVKNIHKTSENVSH